MCSLDKSFDHRIVSYRDGVCPIFKTHNTTSYPDKFADREIKDLTIICENKENGCTWRDRLGNYEVKIQVEFSNGNISKYGKIFLVSYVYRNGLISEIYGYFYPINPFP